MKKVITTTTFLLLLFMVGMSQISNVSSSNSKDEKPTFEIISKTNTEMIVHDLVTDKYDFVFTEMPSGPHINLVTKVPTDQIDLAIEVERAYNDPSYTSKLTNRITLDKKTMIQLFDLMVGFCSDKSKDQMSFDLNDFKFRMEKTTVLGVVNIRIFYMNYGSVYITKRRIEKLYAKLK